MLHDGHHQQRQSHGHDSDEAQDFQQERALTAASRVELDERGTHNLFRLVPALAWASFCGGGAWFRNLAPLLGPFGFLT